MECQSRHHALLAKSGGATAPPAPPAPACLYVTAFDLTPYIKYQFQLLLFHGDDNCRCNTRLSSS